MVGKGGKPAGIPGSPGIVPGIAGIGIFGAPPPSVGIPGKLGSFGSSGSAIPGIAGLASAGAGWPIDGWLCAVEPVVSGFFSAGGAFGRFGITVWSRRNLLPARLRWERVKVTPPPRL